MTGLAMTGLRCGPLPQLQHSQDRKKKPKNIVLGRIFLGYQEATWRDIPDPGPGMSGRKLYANGLFLLFQTGNGRDVPGSALCRKTLG